RRGFAVRDHRGHWPVPPPEGYCLPRFPFASGRSAASVGSHRRLAPSLGPDRGSAVAVGLLTAAAAALGSVPVGPAAAAPHGDTRAEVDRLHQEAEKATEAYNKADERIGLLRTRARDLQDRVARRQ